MLYEMKAVPGPKKRSTTEDFMGDSLGGVPGKKTILVGWIIQVFKKYGGGGTMSTRMAELAVYC